MAFPRSLLVLTAALPFVNECGNKQVSASSDSVQQTALAPVKDTVTEDAPVKVYEIQNSTGNLIETDVFEMKHSSGASAGWGYYLCIDGKRTIRQPIIPCVAGNHPFAGKEDAGKAGQLAADKMKMTGSFPTITLHDLDSLGIKH